jgi:hypothetical protein
LASHSQANGDVGVPRSTDVPGSADVLVCTANETADEKAANDGALASHSQANGDVGVPRSADVPVGTANETANEKATNAELSELNGEFWGFDWESPKPVRKISWL